MLETLLQGQQALNNRLERVEEVRSSHSWRSAESSQGLGWVDHTALDRWYTEATARAAASGHRDASMYIAGDVQSFPRPAELANPWLRPPSWWTSRHEAGLGGLGGCGGPSPPPGFGGQPTPWTFPHPPPALPSSSPPGPPFLGQTPWQSNPFDGPDRSLPQRFEVQVLPEAQALQDRSLQHGFDAQITSEAQAMHGRVGHRGSEAQALHDRSWQASPEASAVQERATLQKAEVQALQERASQQRSEAQAVTDRKRVSGEAKAVGGGSEGSTAMSATTKATISVEGESMEELSGATTAPPALPPGTKLQVRIDGHLRDAVMNDSGGLEAGPAQYYIGSLRHTSPPGVRGNSVPRAPATSPPTTPKIGTSPGLHSTPGGTPVPAGPAPASPKVVASGTTPSKPEEPSRHITELPTLAEPRQRSQGAVLAGDWLAAVAPLMRQLSPSAQTWWAQNLKEAEDHYERWLRATPQQRLQVKASTMAKSFEAGKYCLVEQRGVQLLLKAVPEAFKTDLIATRTLAVNAIVFAILCRWQPGGKLERAQVLDYLVHPEASGSVEETVEGIRKWRRMVLRASELGAVLPDSSLLLKGLDALTQPGLGDHPVVSFRVAAYRNESSVDFAPTQAKVAELAEYLLAEYEALSIQEDPRAQGTKRQRAAAVKAAAKAEARTGAEQSGLVPPPAPLKAASLGTGDKKVCRFWGSSQGCKKAAQCPDHHDRTLLKGTRRCWACSSDQHLKPDCPWGPPEGPSSSTPSARSADSGPKGGKGPKGSGKGGKTKKGEGAAKLQKAQELTSEEVQEATSGAQPTTTADLLKEATEVIRSLKLKALVVRQERGPTERALEVATEGLEGTGLLDTGASTSMRQARPGELDVGCELRNVNLVVGTVKLFVNPGGTLLSTEDIDPLVSVADLVDMGCQLSWCGQECILTHPERGTIRPSTLNKCPEVPRELALELIGDIEVYRKAQRVVIKALREEAASLSSQDFAVLQHRLCQAARGDDKVGVLMSAWLSHKFGDLPACLVDSIALQSDRLGAGAASKWNRRVRRACERDGAFVVVGHPKAFKEAARPCVDLDVETKELCEPDTWRYLLKLAVDGKLRGVIGTAPADFNLCDTSLPDESRDDLARGRQTLALMVLLELAACFYEPLVCLGHPSGQPAGIVRFPKVVLERQLNRVLCKGKVDLFTNAELPSEALCDVPSFAPGATLWSGCVQEAISVVVRSAVELQTGMLSRAATVRAAGGKADASFRQHLAHDHIPWRRDCRHCVEGGIQSRMHRRIKTPEGFVLSVDLLGKYERGVSEHHPKVVWCLVGCYTVPELSVGPPQDQATAQDSRQDVPGEAEAPDLPSDMDCEEYAPSLPGEPLLDEDLDGLWAREEEGPMDWEQAEEDSREFVCAADAELREEEVMSREWTDQEKEHLSTSKMYELPFVVPLPNKREETVLDGIAFMITQIQALGYCVTRLHSDRGREFCNKRLRSFLRHRGIFKTTSEGDHYQQNGRVEGMINRIKRQARVLMTAASVEHQYWPFALQHVAARMRSRLSPTLGGPPSHVLPFGTKVYVRNRRWNRKGQRWAARGLVGTVLAPSVEVTKGHVVLLSDGRLMITTTLLTEVMDPAESVPSGKGDMQPLRRDLPIDERPVPVISHRIPTKRSVRSVREVSPVLQEEDAEALRLAYNPGTSLQELRDHVLGSRWMRTARPRSRGEVFQGGHTHTLGFFRHGGVLGITAECRLFPGFVALLSRLVKEYAPEAR